MYEEKKSRPFSKENDMRIRFLHKTTTKDTRYWSFDDDEEAKNKEKEKTRTTWRATNCRLRVKSHGCLLSWRERKKKKLEENSRKVLFCGMPSIDLYYLPPSPPCRAVMMVAKHVGVKLNLKTIDVLKGEHLKPPFRKVNTTRELFL